MSFWRRASGSVIRVFSSLKPEAEVSLSSAARGFRPQSGYEFPDRFLALCTDES
jgi:hypothetical protein